MSRETDYTVLYKAAADFSALTREATKAKAVLKAMREEEEKANKVSLQDQDRLEKARVRARKALEAQNMAATVSARISREMSERGKREAETVRSLAQGSEAAARQITKLAEAYKKLNAAASGETTSGSAKAISDRSSFAAVSARELEKVKASLSAYMSSAKDTSDTNTRLSGSMKGVKETSIQVADILARLTAQTKKQAESTTEVTVSTKNYGNIVETTTRRVVNAGTEAEKITTTIRRMTKETDISGVRFGHWAGGVLLNLRQTYREAERGESVFARLKRAMSEDSGGRSDGSISNIKRGFDSLGNAASRAVSTIARMPRAIQVAVGIATIFEPAVAVLGSLGAVALGAANNLASLSGVVAALPGLFAAGTVAVGALLTVMGPVIGVFEQYARAQQEAEDTSASSGRVQRDNSQQIAAAARAQRNAVESLGDANRSLKRAQEDLNEAWRDAKRELADLRDEVNRGAEDEEGASIALARAKEEQIKTNKDLKASELDRREAAHRVREAERDLADVRKRNKENKDALSEAERKGLAGSEQVVRAQENVADAHRRVRNAELDLVDAKKRLAAAGVVESTSSARATTQQARYQKMLDGLGPSTRKFIDDLLSMEGAWKKIQKSTQESFFGKIAGDTDKLKSLLPITNTLLNDAASALGNVAHRGIEMITSGPWKADFKKLSKDNAVLIENMGDAGLSVADAFRHITMAAAPFTKWVTAALKDGAASFAAWAKRARSDGSIAEFLEDTKDRLQQMWQITKNVLATLNSWNTASNDFGKWTLARLEAMTKRWRENAKAQEENGSKLKTYLEDVKPLLTALGSLVGAVAEGFANIAADPQNMASTIKLLQTLERQVLPPLLRFLDELNDSGIATTVAEALGKIFDAFANFLEVGGGQVITTFVNTFATIVNLILSIASVPFVGDVVAKLGSAIAFMAAVVVASKFVGLFKLWEMFQWMKNNGSAVASRFREVGDGINSTTTNTSGPVPPSQPQPVGRPTTVTTPGRAISAIDLAAVQANVREYTKAAGDATVKSNHFSRSLDDVNTSSGNARRGLGGLTDFLGGAWGVALLAASVGIAYFMSEQNKVSEKAASYRSALDNISGGYDGVAGSAQRLNAQALNGNPELAEMVNTLTDLGLSAQQIEDAFSGSGPAVETALGAINKAIEETNREVEKQPKLFGEWTWIADKTYNKDNVERLKSLEALKEALKNKKITTEEAARAIEALGLKEEVAAESGKKLISTTQASNFEMDAAREKVASVDQILNTLSDSSSTTAQRLQALQQATELLYGDQISATNATEDFNLKLLDLGDSVKRNGKTLSEFSREGISNRNAIEAAATATKNHTLQLLASGTPYADAIKLHNERIARLRQEAKDAGLNKKETEELIKTFGRVPGNVETDVKMSGYKKVYEELKDLKIAQEALRRGIPVDQAAKEMRKQWNYTGRGNDHTGAGGLATGGPVWGAGSKTSDSIPAWLSNGEWVHKADAVDYYGHGLMSAINSKSIRKETLETAAMLSKASQTREPRIDPEYADGGAVLRLAKGGFAQVQSINQVDNIRQPAQTWNFGVGIQGMVEATKKIFEKWKSNYAVTGGGDGSIGGWKNMWNWVKTRFPYTRLMSGFRPGDPLYHGRGKAIDIGVPDKFGTGRWWNVFNGIKSTFFKNIAELIWDFAGNKAVWNGREHFFNGPKSGPGTHRDHIHFAMKNPSQAFNPGKSSAPAYAGGGLVDFFDFGNLPSPSIPSIPRTNTAALSQAAQSVVNNSTTNGGMNIDKIIVNNPVPERGGDSIRKSLLRTAMLFDEP